MHRSEDGINNKGRQILSVWRVAQGSWPWLLTWLSACGIPDEHLHIDHGNGTEGNGEHQALAGVGVLSEGAEQERQAQHQDGCHGCNGAGCVDQAFHD